MIKMSRVTVTAVIQVSNNNTRLITEISRVKLQPLTTQVGLHTTESLLKKPDSWNNISVQGGTSVSQWRIISANGTSEHNAAHQFTVAHQCKWNIRAQCGSSVHSGASVQMEHQSTIPSSVHTAESSEHTGGTSVQGRTEHQCTKWHMT